MAFVVRKKLTLKNCEALDLVENNTLKNEKSFHKNE
jgi:hypothetical protein